LIKAQSASNSRSKPITINSDTTVLDSLSIIAGSFSIVSSNGIFVTHDEYRIDFANALIISKTLRGNYIVSYRVFSLLLSKPYSHKTAMHYVSKMSDTIKSSSFFNRNALDDSNDGSLETSGSISRGISVGNNQDIIMNSNLNLQIIGDLTENIKIEGSIADNNIPIQPEGNSQQIQDFDKVFIRVYNKQNQAIFGDYEVNSRNGSFLKYHKKGQGIMAETTIKTAKYSETSQASIAISKGKTCRKLFQGSEGNQGPYKLTGCDNELYIVVLSGTEKVFVDGQLKKRGEDNDYTIDYNTGDIVFTPYLPINKDSRIAVDFEYSDKNYARFMVSSNNAVETKKSKTWVNLMSETDNKNQSLQQNLNDSRKQILADAGDNLAYTESGILDSSKSKSKVYYNKKDTTVNGQLYKGIYTISNMLSTEEYSVSFSFVGNNKGDYAQFQSNVNGKAFKWIAPNGENHFGSYMPITVLIAPKKKQVVAIGNEFKISRNTNSIVEMAVSNNDANTFSSKDDNNNNGVALKFGLNHRFILDTITHYIETQLTQTIVDRQFDPFDAYKPVEFDRDWNLRNLKTGNEYLSKINLRSQISLGEMGYSFEYLQRTGIATGNKHSMNGHLMKNDFNLIYTASVMQSKDSLFKTEFDKYNITGSKSFQKITLGLITQQEYNSLDNAQGKLSLASSRFISQKAFIAKSDSTNWECNLSAEIRDDFTVDSSKNSFITSTKSYDYKSLLGFTKNPKNSLKLLFNYRIVDPQSTNLAKQEKNMTGRIEHRLLILKKFISANTFFQLGSGLEAKRIYSYVEVTPGQGIYLWNDQTDYNKNGKADINEFEIANEKLKYQANYIKVFIPTSATISTFSNQFSEMIVIDPRNIIKPNNNIKKVISKFYNLSNYKCTFKTTDNDVFRNINPVRNTKNDTSLITVFSMISNTVYFNRTSSKFSCNYTFSNDQNKTLTSNGWERLNNLKHSLNNRIDIISGLSLNTKAEKGIKSSTIEAVFMDNKNYHIDSKKIEPKITWQPNPYRAFDLLVEYSDLLNIKSEHAIKESLGLESRISGQKSWKLTINSKYIKIKYNAESNTSLAYTMLDGLLPGNNITWEANLQNNLGKNLQLSIQYQGQKSEKTKVLHTGNIQLSAFF